MTSVMLGFPHAHKVTTGFMSSVIAELWPGPSSVSKIYGDRCYPGDDLARGRNRIVSTFLYKTNTDWLWMVDTDISFEPGTLNKLLEVAEEQRIRNGRDDVVVSAHYDQIWESPQPFPYHPQWEIRPASYDFKDFPDGRVGIQDLRLVSREVQMVGAVGAGCLLIHRKTLTIMGQDWFSIRYQVDGSSMGEDISFCLRLRDQKIPLYLAADVNVTHQKEVWV